MQLCLSSNSVLAPRIRFVCPVLELFHPFKLLMEHIWAQPQFLYSFWGPFMHSIYPKTKVFKKPHLKQIEISLLCLRLAYPQIAERLLQFIQIAEEPYLSHARNLWMAFHFFIPLVPMYLIVFSLFCSFKL